MKLWSSQWQLQFNPKLEKEFQDFNRIQTHGPSISVAVLYQLSYEDPYIKSRPICWVHITREWNETYADDVNCRNTNPKMKIWWFPKLQLPLRWSYNYSFKHSYFSNSHHLHVFHSIHSLRWTQQIGLLPMYGSSELKKMLWERIFGRGCIKRMWSYVYEGYVGSAVVLHIWGVGWDVWRGRHGVILEVLC